LGISLSKPTLLLLFPLLAHASQMREVCIGRQPDLRPTRA